MFGRALGGDGGLRLSDRLPADFIFGNIRKKEICTAKCCSVDFHRDGEESVTQWRLSLTVRGCRQSNVLLPHCVSKMFWFKIRQNFQYWNCFFNLCELITQNVTTLNVIFTSPKDARCNKYLNSHTHTHTQGVTLGVM